MLIITMNEQEKTDFCVASSSSSSVQGSKGIKDFFRRRQKSTGSSSSYAVDGAANLADLANPSSSLESNSQVPPLPSKTRSRDDGGGGGARMSSYGNYLTISGTGANALRDLFNKKYRSSNRSSYAVQDGESSKSGFKKTSQGPMPLFRFRSKKDGIREERRRSPSPNPLEESSSRSSCKNGASSSRDRHISGPLTSVYGTSPDSDARFRSLKCGSPSVASGGRMRSFFDSFRQRSRTISQDASSDDQSIGTAADESKVSSSSSKKKKKFRVTPALQTMSLNRKEHCHVGPDEFFELYRRRTNSDPRSDEKPADVHGCMYSSPSLSKANTIHSCEPLHVVIWRDKKTGTKVFRLPKRYTDNIEFEDVADVSSEDLAFARFMKSHHCYDVMPSSSKLVIFDTQLSVKKAFFALVQNGVRSAPLWDSDRQDFVGMLTITDFIQILQKYYRSPQERMDELEEHRVATWKEVLHGYDRKMVLINPDESLLDAVRSLCQNKVHRLLVVDQETGNALHILTHKRILRFLQSYMGNICHPSFMQMTLDELKIGSYDNIATATPETPLIEALNMFVERRISALPIIDSDRKVVDIYTKFDVLGLAAEKVYYNLDQTINDAMKNSRKEEFEGVQTCLLSEKLVDIVDRIVTVGVHRLVVVDNDRYLKGIVSLSDLLHHLVLHPFESQKLEITEEEIDGATMSKDCLTSDTTMEFSENLASAAKEDEEEEGRDLMKEYSDELGWHDLLETEEDQQSVDGYGGQLEEKEEEEDGIIPMVTDGVDGNECDKMHKMVNCLET